jgi:C1A family cysteine protease
MSYEQAKLMFSRFQNFMATHKKVYPDTETMIGRYQIFQENYIKLQQTLTDTKQTHKSGITQFFDLTPEEFSRTFLTLQVSVVEKLKAISQSKPDSPKRRLVTMPTNYDWRNYGVVGPVKNQGSCGCCWAFSTIATLESQYKIKTGKLYSFSEQQLLDCVTANMGCYGGNIMTAMNFLKNYNGIMLESSYSYLSYQSTCRYNSNYALSLGDIGFYSAYYDEESIRSLLYSVGPLAIYMNAEVLQYYYGGIITSCPSSSLNHAVVIVGYGTSTSGIDYWIIRNSWGPYWGESGYFRIQRNRGLCGVNQYSYAPRLQ